MSSYPQNSQFSDNFGDLCASNDDDSEMNSRSSRSFNSSIDELMDGTDFLTQNSMFANPLDTETVATRDSLFPYDFDSRREPSPERESSTVDELKVLEAMVDRLEGLCLVQSALRAPELRSERRYKAASRARTYGRNRRRLDHDLSNEIKLTYENRQNSQTSMSQASHESTSFLLQKKQKSQSSISQTSSESSSRRSDFVPVLPSRREVRKAKNYQIPKHRDNPTSFTFPNHMLVANPSPVYFPSDAGDDQSVFSVKEKAKYLDQQFEQIAVSRNSRRNLDEQFGRASSIRRPLQLGKTSATSASGGSVTQSVSTKSVESVIDSFFEKQQGKILSPFATGRRTRAPGSVTHSVSTKSAKSVESVIDSFFEKRTETFLPESQAMAVQSTTLSSVLKIGDEVNYSSEEEDEPDGRIQNTSVKGTNSAKARAAEPTKNTESKVQNVVEDEQDILCPVVTVKKKKKLKATETEPTESASMNEFKAQKIFEDEEDRRFPVITVKRKKKSKSAEKEAGLAESAKMSEAGMDNCDDFDEVDRRIPVIAAKKKKKSKFAEKEPVPSESAKMSETAIETSNDFDEADRRFPVITVKKKKKSKSAEEETGLSESAKMSETEWEQATEEQQDRRFPVITVKKKKKSKSTEKEAGLSESGKMSETEIENCYDFDEDDRRFPVITVKKKKKSKSAEKEAGLLASAKMSETEWEQAIEEQQDRRLPVITVKKKKTRAKLAESNLSESTRMSETEWEHATEEQQDRRLPVITVKSKKKKAKSADANLSESTRISEAEHFDDEQDRKLPKKKKKSKSSKKKSVSTKLRETELMEDFFSCQNSRFLPERVLERRPLMAASMRSVTTMEVEVESFFVKQKERRHSSSFPFEEGEETIDVSQSTPSKTMGSEVGNLFEAQESHIRECSDGEAPPSPAPMSRNATINIMEKFFERRSKQRLPTRTSPEKHIKTAESTPAASAKTLEGSMEKFFENQDHRSDRTNQILWVPWEGDTTYGLQSDVAAGKNLEANVKKRVSAITGGLDAAKSLTSNLGTLTSSIFNGRLNNLSFNINLASEADPQVNSQNLNAGQSSNANLSEEGGISSNSSSDDSASSANLDESSSSSLTL